MTLDNENFEPDIGAFCEQLERTDGPPAKLYLLAGYFLELNHGYRAAAEEAMCAYIESNTVLYRELADHTLRVAIKDRVSLASRNDRRMFWRHTDSPANNGSGNNGSGKPRKKRIYDEYTYPISVNGEFIALGDATVEDLDLAMQSYMKHVAGTLEPALYLKGVRGELAKSKKTRVREAMSIQTLRNLRDKATAQVGKVLAA